MSPRVPHRKVVMVSRTLIAVQISNYLKSTFVIKVATMKNYDGSNSTVFFFIDLLSSLL